MHFLGLPNELLLNVASHFNEVHHIACLIRTNRRLYHLLISYLYDVDFQRQNNLLCCDFEAEPSDRNPFLGIQNLTDRGTNLSAKFAYYLRQSFKSIGQATYFASRWGHARVVAFLLQNGASCGDPGFCYRSTFHTAIRFGHEEVARLFIANGAPVNDSMNYYSTALKPLHLASSRAKVNVVLLLLDSGANIHARDESYRTPLHYALHALKLSDDDLRVPPYKVTDIIATIGVLMSYGADLNAADDREVVIEEE